MSWLADLDAGNYERTWTKAAPVFKEQVNAKQWQHMAQNARKPLGRLIHRKLAVSTYHNTLPGAPPGDYVVFQFNTRFADKKDAVETVTPVLVDGHWSVSGYFVR